MAISRTQPKYELRARRHGPGDTELEIWQLPSPTTPQVTTPIRVAGLRGRNLELVEHRVLKKLKEVGVRIDILPIDGMGSLIAEETALNLALLFRTLAPMRSRDAMRLVAEGIDQMSREEAAYWLGMAVHRKNPRRVLTALRVLMTDPKRK
ncbi:hypothetical protein ACMA5K_33860 [Bradyrhizobium diazoefficiens]|uniref:DUF7680 family protein n=1 Tax=Bradyrhizobium diazoefficiens TaxID=1355477 RepID=UPI0015B5195F|nr:hypothetical protein [Bradyrhizobium diazoefficiens]QLD45607.1 hypothetical protein HUW42_33520 [Bradyrhizobium diazoefficiens]